MVYNKFSDYLKKRYGAKVYKLPVSLSASCPNRDGTIRMETDAVIKTQTCDGNGGQADDYDDAVDCAVDEGSYCGCIFCGIEGSGFETLPAENSIREQLETNMRYIAKNTALKNSSHISRTIQTPTSLSTDSQRPCTKRASKG